MNRLATFDIQRARAETRASSHIIHFNNAGAALMPIPVSDALHAYLNLEERQGGYETEAQQEAALEHFYQAAAQLLNCTAAEIAFVDSASRAWTQAFYALDFQPGDRIVTTLAEYGSNVIAFNQQAQRYGAEIVFAPNDEYGQVDVAALADLIDERVRLICLSHIPTAGGLVNPAPAVGAVARAAGVPFLLDACQSVGQLPLDVQVLGCDMLSGAGRKYLRGPRGTGFLYVRREWIERLNPPLLDMRSATLLAPDQYAIRPDARRFELWERYCAGQAALGVAIDYALDWGLAAIRDRVYHLAGRLRQGLADLPGVTVTDTGREQCGLVTFTAAAQTPVYIKTRLAANGINVATSSGTGSLVDFQARGLDAVVRASVHYYNTEEEIAIFLETLGRVLA